MQILLGKNTYLMSSNNYPRRVFKFEVLFKVRKVIDTKFQNFAIMSFEITINKYY